MRSTDNQIEIYQNKRIAVIAGGISSEREISFKSAENVLAALKEHGLNAFILDPSKEAFFDTEFDIAFNCLHGKWGEDGCLQGYCEVKGISYTGPCLLPTSIGLNKPIFKEIVSSLNIPVPNSISSINPKYPMVVKPKSEGSSLGVSIVKSEKEWEDLKRVKPEVNGPNYFCEEFIDGVEVASGVLEINGEPTVLPIVEIKTNNEFYDYDGKYTPGKSELIIPANISKEIEKEIRELSLKIYDFFECKGCIRIDLIINSEGPRVLEMNTSPGLTKKSNIPAQALAMGISFDRLILHILSSAKL